MKTLLYMAALLAMVGPTTAADKTLISDWRANEIKIDGSAEEWTGGVLYLEKEKIAVSVQSDSQFLYLCLRPDRSWFRHAMMAGFTVWFDSTAKSKKILGIRFPIGRQGMPMDRPAENSEPGRDRGAFMSAAFAEIEIIGPEKGDLNRLPAQNNYGIIAAVGQDPETPVYELQVPLSKEADKAYRVAAAPGTRISLGLESSKMKRPERGGRTGFRSNGGEPGGEPGEPGGMGGGRRGGMGGGMHGGMGGGRGGRGPEGMAGRQMEKTDPIKIWIKVDLALPQK